MAKVLVVPVEGQPYEREFELGDYDGLLQLIEGAIAPGSMVDLHGFTVADADGVDHKVQAWVDDWGLGKGLPMNHVASIFARTPLVGTVVFSETIGPDTVSLSDTVIEGINHLFERLLKY